MTRRAKECSIDWSDLPKGAGQSVLVVDDEVALARLVQENLGDLGYQAEAFGSSATALQAFRQEPGRYDAVVTDDRMPGLSGTELIREIRSIRADLPALIVSGHVSADLLTGARRVGAAEVLRKPVALSELAWAVARLMSHGD
ncbi:Response regulator containing CheY-like receiver, AAA-type ATPase, and DNA-binding domains [Variovorax sp. HW608]|uniref:response regulator n=1 Tax=Variovorax sp. HW608 TaxID=1034889 RepID=UPI00081FFA72|nr:response regulator [Variovorax sp. HW608]SCK08393.1 Response regulator containing CheY-like receiver, AAA-type ATPase, and DNA-binding domains [Variovorax sp. HW608]